MMAALVEQATQGAGVPGISGATVRETLDRLFSDDVHLTPLGSYYLALVTDATLHGRPPVGAWSPDGVNPALAKSLQQFAWDALATYRADNQPLDLASCRRVLTDGFIGQFWRYSRDATPEQEQSKLRGYWRSTRNIVSDHWQVRRNNASNPLHYDATTERTTGSPRPDLLCGPSRQPPVTLLVLLATAARTRLVAANAGHGLGQRPRVGVP